MIIVGGGAVEARKVTLMKTSKYLPLILLLLLLLHSKSLIPIFSPHPPSFQALLAKGHAEPNQQCTCYIMHDSGRWK